MDFKIYEINKFGKLTSEGIEYFKPYNGGLKTIITTSNAVIVDTILNPTERDMNHCGWYRVINVWGDGVDHIEDNILYCYKGTPAPITEEENV